MNEFSNLPTILTKLPIQIYSGESRLLLQVVVRFPGGGGSIRARGLAVNANSGTPPGSPSTHQTSCEVRTPIILIALRTDEGLNPFFYVLCAGSGGLGGLCGSPHFPIQKNGR